MSSSKAIVASFLKFLEDEIQSGSLSDDARESLEVACQCLESSYNVRATDAASLGVHRPLTEIFRNGIGGEIPEPSPSDKASAEKFKEEGNELMKKEKFQEALNAYTKAIDLDPANAVFYCNRAASYSNLNQHQQALDDCKKALTINSSYSKAYSRKGLSHSNLGQYREARDCYKKALQLDPDNQGYKANLDVAEQKLRDMGMGEEAPSGGGMPNLGGLDLASLFNNPAMLNMAAQMMSNPQMQQMLSGAMAGGQGGGQGGMADILSMGQQLAQQISQTNPELVEELKAHVRQPNNPDDRAPPGST